LASRARSWVRSAFSLLLLVLMIALWLYWPDAHERVPIRGRMLTVADGDSFAIGSRKFRLDGIDAPEYRQTCSNAAVRAWECGKVSRAALEQFLREPDLACTAGAIDDYGRNIATCSNARRTDIAADQVRSGMAVSDEYFAIRSYGVEEDEARDAKRGLWTGDFLRPDEWRAANGR
jgi:endonuclease YncB( thermonuclease family)